MRRLLLSAVLAALGMVVWSSPALAGPFGLFTKAMFGKCLHCACEKPYNAFTPPGYNPLIHRAYPAASAPIMGVNMIGNGMLGSVPAGGPGCATCGQQPVMSGPIQPIPAGSYPISVTPSVPLGAYPQPSMPSMPSMPSVPSTTLAMPGAPVTGAPATPAPGYPNYAVPNYPVPTYPVPGAPVPNNGVPGNPVPSNSLPSNPLPYPGVGNPVPATPLPGDLKPLPSSPLPSSPLPSSPLPTLPTPTPAPQP